MWSSEDNFGKLELLTKLQVMHTQTFKKSTISSKFKRIRLIPYNSKVILQQVHAFPSFTRANPINKMGSVCTTTSHQLNKITNQAITLINSMKRDQ